MGDADQGDTSAAPSRVLRHPLDARRVVILPDVTAPVGIWRDEAVTGADAVLLLTGDCATYADGGYRLARAVTACTSPGVLTGHRPVRARRRPPNRDGW